MEANMVKFSLGKASFIIPATINLITWKEELNHTKWYKYCSVFDRFC